MDKIGSVEFGNWLINELMKEKLLPKSQSKLAVKTKDARIADLKSAEKLLLEFLLHQEDMIGRAGW